MKGRKSSENSNGSPTNASDPTAIAYQTPSGVRRKYQAPSPNKHLIAPGLVIEGEEADL